MPALPRWPGGMADVETYIDAQGVERCDDCDETLDDCACTCPEAGDSVHECAGPGCEHEEES